MIEVVPGEDVPFEDLQTVLGTGHPGRCQCQRYKLGRYEWTAPTLAERAAALEREPHGLVAYLDGEPAGWCAVEPRTAYEALLAMRSPVLWHGRDEDRDDDGVWSVTCFVTRVGFRKRGVSAALAAATVGYARERGAAALEAYPMRTEPGKDIAWDELHVGALSSFLDAGFREVSTPTKRRVVVRVDLA